MLSAASRCARSRCKPPIETMGRPQRTVASDQQLMQMASLPDLSFVYVGSLSTIATIAMEEIQSTLDSMVSKISDGNYEELSDFHRFWLDTGQTYHQIPDLVLNTILNSRTTSSINAERGELIHPTAHLILRFANDIESDHILTRHNAGLQNRLCTTILRSFFFFSFSFGVAV